MLALGRVAPALQIAPPVPVASPMMPSFTGQHFGGKVAGFTLVREALTAEQIKKLAGSPPKFGLIEYEEGVEAVAGADARAGRISRAAGSGDVAEEPRAVSGSGGEAGGCRTGFAFGRTATISGRWRADGRWRRRRR